MSETPGRRRVRTGQVVSDRMDRTVVIAVERRVRHPLYGKELRRIGRLYAHDEANEFRVGDVVTIEETRPLSRMKRWRVLGLVQRREAVPIAPDASVGGGRQGETEDGAVGPMTDVVGEAAGASVGAQPSPEVSEALTQNPVESSEEVSGERVEDEGTDS